METDLLTAEEAASLLGLAPASIRKLIQLGKLAGAKRGRDWFVARTEADRYATTNRRPGRKSRHQAELGAR